MGHGYVEVPHQEGVWAKEHWEQEAWDSEAAEWHWGSAAADHTPWRQQAPRIAMSFASADSTFEEPFLSADACC